MDSLSNATTISNERFDVIHVARVKWYVSSIIINDGAQQACNILFTKLIKGDLQLVLDIFW